MGGRFLIVLCQVSSCSTCLTYITLIKTQLCDNTLNRKSTPDRDVEIRETWAPTILCCFYDPNI